MYTLGAHNTSAFFMPGANEVFAICVALRRPVEIYAEPPCGRVELIPGIYYAPPQAMLLAQSLGSTGTARGLSPARTSEYWKEAGKQ